MFNSGSLNLMRVESVGVPPDRLHSADSPKHEDVGRDLGDPASD
jgi:hypothetical protein